MSKKISRPSFPHKYLRGGKLALKESKWVNLALTSGYVGPDGSQ